MSMKGQRQRRHLHDQAPPSARAPSGNLAARDLEGMQAELQRYHERFHDLFARREQRQWSAFYLRGQLSDLERKSIEPMVLAEYGPDMAKVRAGQQFLGAGAFNDSAILRRHQGMVAETLGEADAALIVDGSGFPKQGQHSVGVARQYCGHLGKVANCQVGVFAAYASSKGHTFLDCRLYMPRAWFDDEHAPLRQRYGVPEDLHFATEPELALQMIEGLVARGEVPFRWVLADQGYGKVPGFLDRIDALGKEYFIEVPLFTSLWPCEVELDPPGQGSRGRPRRHARLAPGQPKRCSGQALADSLAPDQWHWYTVTEGARGPLQAQFAFVRITRARGRHPGEAAWAVLRRGPEADGALKLFLCNAPPDCDPRTLVRLSARRWPVETAFLEAKGELGMDHYEVRSWRGWHHQMTQTFLAHHFLVGMRLRLKKSPRTDFTPDVSAAGRGAGAPEARPGTGAGDRGLSPAAKPRRLPFSPQAYTQTKSAAQKSNASC